MILRPKCPNCKKTMVRSVTRAGRGLFQCRDSTCRGSLEHYTRDGVKVSHN